MVNMKYSIGFMLFGLAFGLKEISNKPWEPVPKDDNWWLERHRSILNTTATRANEIKVVFIGSSSVEYWGTAGKDLWDSKYAPQGAVNYGIRKDRTENVLWRIENGTLDGLSPKLVVIYIGGNNIRHNTEAEVVRGVIAVIDKIHEKLPNANLLFTGFFPRGDRDGKSVRDTLSRSRNITDTLKPMIEGNEKRKSHFLDIFWSLAPKSMDAIYEQYYQDDKLHLNKEGYDVWDKQMSSIFNSLLK